jgi:hypothetical protein
VGVEAITEDSGEVESAQVEWVAPESASSRADITRPAPLAVCRPTSANPAKTFGAPAKRPAELNPSQ